MTKVNTTANRRTRDRLAVAAAAGGGGGTGTIADNTAHGSTSFSYTGANQTWLVPTGVVFVDITMYGAKGGPGDGVKVGGSGARVVGTLAVTPGETLNMTVGGSGISITGGYNGGGNGGNSTRTGGGGGGASDIRRGGTALANRVVVAGGAGGGSGSYATGYDGAHSGTDATRPSGQPVGGLKGTQVAGGAKGDNSGNSQGGTNGALGVGGSGFGGSNIAAGGGGGGYYGGGGGGCDSFTVGYSGAGGGGSSYIAGLQQLPTPPVLTDGNNNAAGSIGLVW